MTDTKREFEKWYGNKLAECRANNDKDMHSFYTKQKAILELGFKAALAHSQQWISVEDRLPDYGVDVIAMEADGKVYRLYRREHSQYFWDVDRYYYTDVVFWMPFTPPITNRKD